MRARLLLLMMAIAASVAIAATCGDPDDPSAPVETPTATATARPSSVPTFPADREVTWDEAVNLIMDCEVTQAFQAHSLDVSLTLRDGSRVHTVEPAIDDMFDVFREAATRGCEQIPLATE